MDRYPVTVARYALFVDAGGYDDEELWDDEGWAWRSENAILTPRWWEEQDPHWARFLTPDRPIVGVSWYEARAFCRFAGRRLPSEAEWEAAARGPEGRLYPWGDSWEPERAGNRGKGPRLTWPVGSFPAAEGPFGHHDLVANVWQWTSDPWPDPSSSSMAARGGAWSARDEHCRSDHRNAYEKDGRWSHVGFRTVAL